MRSVELLRRIGLLTALCALAGCASLAEPLKAIQDNVVTPVAKALTPSSAASAASAPVVAAPVKVVEPDVPVNPQAQRAFDDSVRALRAGRTDDAERGFVALTKSNPELGGPHANLGVIYRQAGKLPEAVAEFEKATHASPRQAIYFNQLGITYRQQGEFKKARTAYEQAIELDPAYAAPVLNLGILHDLYLNDSARALEQYDLYLALSPAKDATVVKWVADLKNRKPATSMLTKKELP